MNHNQFTEKRKSEEDIDQPPMIKHRGIKLRKKSDDALDVRHILLPTPPNTWT
jgi:hypothetical protein